MLAEITTTTTTEDITEDAPNFCVMDYEIELQIGEETIFPKGWLLCGWLPSGSSSDLDGSGLANWGDSQPGGWSSCDGDGTMSGAPRVVNYGEYGDPICIDNGEGLGNVEVHPESVPEWAKAVAQAQCLEDKADVMNTDEAWCRFQKAEKHANKIRVEICDALQSAINGAIPESVPEPKAEDVFDVLYSSCECMNIRYGNYQGAGYVLAVRIRDDEYEIFPYPTVDDVARAFKLTSDNLIAEIYASIRSDCDDTKEN